MIKVEYLSILMLLMSLGLKKKNTLTTLLTLEILRIIIIFVILKIGNEIFFGLLMLCIGACEGAVGLGALVRMSRLIAQRIYDTYTMNFALKEILSKRDRKENRSKKGRQKRISSHKNNIAGDK